MTFHPTRAVTSRYKPLQSAYRRLRAVTCSWSSLRGGKEHLLARIEWRRSNDEISKPSVSTSAYNAR